METLILKITIIKINSYVRNPLLSERDGNYNTCSFVNLTNLSVRNPLLSERDGNLNLKVNISFPVLLSEIHYSLKEMGTTILAPLSI